MALTEQDVKNLKGLSQSQAAERIKTDGFYELPSSKRRGIVCAPACFLEEDNMKDKNIDFVGVPYNLFRRE
jgi:hypothetical protein